MIDRAMLAFDEQKHEYRWRGAWKPGCTRVLADTGYIQGASFFTPESRIRGQQVHKAGQLVDLHCPEAKTVGEVLEVISLGDGLIPYVQGYLLFKKEKGFRAIHNELPLYSTQLGVAGITDIIGVYADGRTVLVDMKSWKAAGPTPKPAAVLQTAGYKIMAEEAGMKIDLRVILAVPGNGKYRSYDCTDDGQDEFEFSCAAHTWWGRVRRGLLVAGGESEIDIAEPLAA